MAKKGTADTRVTKEWARHLKKHGKRIANKTERKASKHRLAITI
jgi:hypothetical protein